MSTGGFLTVSGSLEDLSFPDILQVIHVSRQSGTLVLTGPEGERRVRFRNGLVCGATLAKGGPELEDLLVQKGLVAAAFLAPARARQALTGESLSTSLVALGAVSQETIDRLIRDALRSQLRSLVLLQAGEFHFELPREGARRAETGLGLQEGLEPEAILDGLLERPPAPRPAEASPEVGAGAAPPRHVLLVTDRSSLRLALREEFRRKGLEVTACSGAAPALDRARSLIERQVAFDLVCELILPDTTGAGWRAGLDLIRELRGPYPRLRALVLGEIRHPSASEAARAAGATDYLPMPDLKTVGFAEVGPKMTEFCTRVSAVLRHPGRPGAAGCGQAWDGAIRATDPLSLLRGLIGEMRSDHQSDIGLLVLRLAAEYFDRGILFTLGDGEVHGVGAFGPEPGGGSGAGIEQRIRGAALALEKGSMLDSAVRARAMVQGPIDPCAANTSLLERLGRPPPREATLLPLLSGSDVFGILYGDNVGSGRPAGDLKALEIFLSQAGMALQNSLLKRRLESLTGRQAVGAGGGSVPA